MSSLSTCRVCLFFEYPQSCINWLLFSGSSTCLVQLFLEFPHAGSGYLREFPHFLNFLHHSLSCLIVFGLVSLLSQVRVIIGKLLYFWKLFDIISLTDILQRCLRLQLLNISLTFYSVILRSISAMFSNYSSCLVLQIKC